VGAAVEAVAGQQVIPGAQHAQERGRHRRHARRVAIAACAPSRAASLSCRYR
jgi:hypothetical protein